MTITDCGWGGVVTITMAGGGSDHNYGRWGGGG